MNVTGYLTAPNTTLQPTAEESESTGTEELVRADVSAGFAHVSVLDISRADADAISVGDAVIGLDPVGPNFPIPFEIEIVGDVIPNRRYCVRAVVRAADGALRWTTDTVYPVALADTLTGDDTVRSDASKSPLIDVGALNLIAVGRSLL